MLDLPNPKEIGRGEYAHVIDWLQNMSHNAQEDGGEFTKPDAVESLLSLRSEIDGVIKLLGGPDQDVIWRMHEVGTDFERDTLDDLLLRAGITWNCPGDGTTIVCWSNRETDLICGNCLRPRPKEGEK